MPDAPEPARPVAALDTTPPRGPVARVVHTCRVVGRILYPLRINLVILALVFLALWVPDQSHDALIALVEDVQAARLQRILQLIAGALFLGVVMWTTSRWLLNNRPPEVPDTRWCRFLIVALPHVLASLAFAALAAGFFKAGSSVLVEETIREIADFNVAETIAHAANLRDGLYLGVLGSLLLLGVGLVIALALEGLFAVRRAGQHAEHTLVDKAVKLADRQGLRLGIAISAIIAAIGLLVSLVTPGYAVLMGPMATVLYAASCWSFVLSAPVAALPRAPLPVLSVLVVSLALTQWFGLDDNHEIRAFERSVTDRPVPIDRSYMDWLASRTDADDTAGEYPVFVVATEGGGVRAAYWTATVLAHLNESVPGFGHHLYAISGVSGGSVGAAVYAALVAEYHGDPPDRPMTGTARRVLARDLLSPILARGAVFGIAQRGIPSPITRLDRARVLERSLEASWSDEFDSIRLRTGFYALREGPEARDVPVLLLNTTDVQTGRRVLVSHVSLVRPREADQKQVHDPERALPETLWEDTPLEIPLSTAAFLGARFPVVTPAGTVSMRDSNGAPEGGRVRFVDGGYFENSGTATALDVVGEMIRARPTPQAADLARRARIYVIRIRYIEPGALERGDTSARLSELLAPVGALLTAREARGHQSRVQLDQFLRATARAADDRPGDAPVQAPPRAERLRDSPVYGSVIRFEMRSGSTRLPLGWALSRKAAHDMDAQLPAPDADGPNAPALRQIIDAMRGDDGP